MSGVIGRGGKFYPCGITEHTVTIIANLHDGPFVVIRSCYGDYDAEFYDYYTESKTLPTQEQYEALIKFCEDNGQSFEYITDCWRDPWEQWRQND